MKFIASFIMVGALFANARAQIAFTESDYIKFETALVSGIVDTAQNPSILAPIIGKSGPHQTWDFTQAFYGLDGFRRSTFAPYSDTIIGATDSSFLSATYVEESPPDTFGSFILLPTNEFFRVDSLGAWELGGCNYSRLTGVQVFDLTPPEELIQFPFTYQSSWQGTSELTSEESPRDSWATQTAVADGYGTLMLPGYSGNSLRVKESTITKDSGQGVVTRDTEFSYEFYTLDGYSALISTSANGNISAASYTSPSLSVVNPSANSMPEIDIVFTQNPVRDGSTALLFTLPKAEPVQVELMDILGRSVRMLENGFGTAGTHSIPISTRGLTVGTYFIRLESNGERAIRKLVVQ